RTATSRHAGRRRRLWCRRRRYRHRRLGTILFTHRRRTGKSVGTWSGTSILYGLPSPGTRVGGGPDGALGVSGGGDGGGGAFGPSLAMTCLPGVVSRTDGSS